VHKERLPPDDWLFHAAAIPFFSVFREHEKRDADGRFARSRQSRLLFLCFVGLHDWRRDHVVERAITAGNLHD